MNEMNGTPFDRGRIPEELWSDYAEGPFEECSVCARPLGDALYQIQKVSNQRETILELAFCFACGQSVAAEYSERSLRAIRGFLEANMDFSRPASACTLCGAVIADSPTYSASALCAGSRLVLPIVRVCSSCEEAVQELMSEETKKAHGEFMDRTFPGVPADLDLAPKLIF